MWRGFYKEFSGCLAWRFYIENDKSCNRSVSQKWQILVRHVMSGGFKTTGNHRDLRPGRYSRDVLSKLQIHYKMFNFLSWENEYVQFKIG